MKSIKLIEQLQKTNPELFDKLQTVSDTIQLELIEAKTRRFKVSNFRIRTKDEFGKDVWMRIKFTQIMTRERMVEVEDKLIKRYGLSNKDVSFGRIEEIK